MRRFITERNTEAGTIRLKSKETIKTKYKDRIVQFVHPKGS